MRQVFKIKLLVHTDNTVNSDKVKNKSTGSQIIFLFSRHCLAKESVGIIFYSETR